MIIEEEKNYYQNIVCHIFRTHWSVWNDNKQGANISRDLLRQNQHVYLCHRVGRNI